MDACVIPRQEELEELLGTLSVLAREPIMREVLEVPPEIWALVVALSGRQSIGRLCAVSHRFYSIFTPLLYSTTTEPPLTAPQSALLIRTLRKAHTSLLRPHLVHIQSLSLSDYHGIDTPQCLAALRNLMEIRLDGHPMRGSALRTLKWSLSRGTEELARLLRTPGNFPHLKEISVECRGKTARFDFIQIPNLEKLECFLSLAALSYDFAFQGGPREVSIAQEYKAWATVWSVLAEALMTLPSSSPHLKTLNLELHMYAENTNSESAPWDTYAALINTINRMRLPALTSMELYVTGCKSRTDLSPFLLGHPSLTNLALRVDGMHILTNLDGASLSELRSFTGCFKECAAISALARELEHLTIKFPGFALDDEHGFTGLPLLTPKLFPSALCPTVKCLNVLSFDEGGQRTLRYPGHELSALSFNCLARAFPNITHLDIFLGEEMSRYHDSFVELLGLEYLCIRERKRVEEEELKLEPATTVFPPEEYGVQLNAALLPFLNHLADVHLILRGDRSIDHDDICCPCCDRDLDLPDWLLEYRFFVNRECGEAELVLVGQKVSEAEY
ncbi:hypothetical protein FB451DRAFT_1274950 [Mycena latifolia]|nr:hypothetical protein FB451DRAFT_1274950 [Mycena latifolia]